MPKTILFAYRGRMGFAEIVRERRENLGLSLREAAEKTDGAVSATNWKNLENGTRPVTSARRRTLLGVCRALEWPDSAIDDLRAERWPEGGRSDEVVATLELGETKFMVRRLKGRKMTADEVDEAIAFIRAQAEGPAGG